MAGGGGGRAREGRRRDGWQPHKGEEGEEECFNFERRDDSDLEYNAYTLPIRSNTK